MARLLLKMVRRQRFEFSELFAFGPQFWPFLGAALLLWLAYCARFWWSPFPSRPRPC